MDELIEALPPKYLTIFARCLERMAAKAMRRAALADMTEVWDRQATIQERLYSEARRAAKLPDAEAVAAILTAVPEADETRARAHLALARRKLKRETRVDMERRIAARVQHGQSNAAIAYAEGISLSTAARKAAQSKGVRT